MNLSPGSPGSLWRPPTAGSCPGYLPFKIVLVGLQKVQGLSEEGFVLQPGNVVVGPGQLAVHFGGAAFSGDGLQCVNDPLILIVLIPKLALLQ